MLFHCYVHKDGFFRICFSGDIFFVYAFRVNISVAVFCMVKSPVDNSSLLGKFSNSTYDTCGILDYKDDESEASITLHI